MEKILQDPLPEIVFGSADSHFSRAISKAIKEGKLRKLAPRIYTSNLVDSNETIIARHRFQILAHLFPGAVISYRSALEGGFTHNTIFLTYIYTRKVSMSGLTIRLIQGSGPQAGDTPFMDTLFYASQARAFLENMSIGRQRETISKALTLSEVEVRLEKFCTLQGIDAFNRLREDARHLAIPLQMTDEFNKLDQIMGAILGTRDVALTAPTAIARSRGLPYDNARMELFADLLLSLKSRELPLKKTEPLTDEILKNLAFFEAYFSNYIEGTKFLIEEAVQILFEHKIIAHRQDDSHDILGTYQIVANRVDMQTVPQTHEELIQLLQKRHASIMAGRPDKTPGVFKDINNQAGNTLFVAPELVRGTLIKGFDMYLTLEPGIARSIFMMFLIAEVHPFLDGNGRLARIMMNAELAAVNQYRIIIPTVYREDYLLALKKFSHQHDPDAFIRMLVRAQAFTASIDFSSYNAALAAFQQSQAFLEPYQGKLRFDGLK